MTVRDDFATALSTVDGVNGYAKRPKALKVGDAWPLLSSIDRAEGLVFEVTWRVMILLPQEEIAASDWIDSHAADLVVALNPVAIVDQLAPVTTVVNSTDQLALQLTLRREA
jgi:hypothetical protein